MSPVRNRLTVLFFGRSGSGKGTQVVLLEDYLKKNDPERGVAKIETGARLREFIKLGNPTALKIKAVLDRGGFLPAFIPIKIWAEAMMEEFVSGEHIIIDGASRRLEEAPILASSLDFYSEEGNKPYIIFLDISEEEVRERLLKRGRYDDDKERIEERLRSFDKYAMPAIEYLEKCPSLNFVKVDASQGIEKVFEEIKEILKI